MAQMPQIERVCPLLNAGVAMAGKAVLAQTPANRCREDCQWYMGGKCAVEVIAEKLGSISTMMPME